MDDPSLDEFLDGERAESADGPAAERAGSDDADRTAAAPAEVTFQWAPESECAACGAAAPRRWRDEGEPVCADCKAW